MKSLLSLIFILSLISCSPGQFPFDEYDYTINNVQLGLSFVPDSDPDMRAWTAGHLNTLNIGHVRMAQSWHLREPVNGTFYWLPLKDRLDFYEQQGVQVLLTLDTKEFPDWTSAMSSSQIETEFSQYVTALLTNFGSQIAFIQLGNEWNWEIDTYLGGDDDHFIALNNILYSAVQALPLSERPEVLLGSLSIGGLRLLALVQEKIDNVYFDGTPLYTQSEIDDTYIDANNKLVRMTYIISNSDFSRMDLHFYDEYWNWPLYKEAVLQVLSNAAKPDLQYHSIVASEYGGPEPDLEGNDPTIKAERLISYIHTLDSMGVSHAYYFKLAEGGDTSLIAHPNSFLIDSDLNETWSYEVMRRFGQ